MRYGDEPPVHDDARLPRGGENTFTYVLRHARQAADAERLLRALPAARDDVRRRKIRRWLDH